MKAKVIMRKPWKKTNQVKSENDIKDRLECKMSDKVWDSPSNTFFDDALSSQEEVFKIKKCSRKQ